eukprot:PITA_02336
MGKPTPKDEMPLQPQVIFEPFEKWGMDFVGPINPPSSKKQYIIVSTEYLTKWEETKEIKVVTEEKVAEFLGKTYSTSSAQLDLDLSHAQKEILLQLNGLDEYRLQALFHTQVVQLQRKIWHDRYIKEKQFQEGDWALLYDSRYKDFKGKLRTRWLGPYTVEKCNHNGSILIKTIDDEAIPMLVNGHRSKVYKKPFSK